MVLILNVWLISYEFNILEACVKVDSKPTSIENRTPPIGEPKATATPAALAAVRISRILPEATVNRVFSLSVSVKRTAYLDSVKNEETGWL